MNIFAEVLADVLAEHGRELGSLYSMTTELEAINQHKVTLLKRTLARDTDRSAVLSAWELEVMRAYFRRTPRAPGQPPEPISDQQDRRLKAAIFAEGIRRLVLERLKSEAEHTGELHSQDARDTAYRVGKLVYELLLTTKDPQGVERVDSMMDRLRGGLDSEEDLLRDAGPLADSYVSGPPLAVEAPEDPLAIGVEAFMQGSLWLEVARGLTNRELQQALATYALALLTRAQKYADDVAPPDQREVWHSEIVRALKDTRDLL